MNTLSLRVNEQFKIYIHELTYEKLREIAILLGREHAIKSLNRDDGSVFHVVNYFIGNVEIELYT